MLAKYLTAGVAASALLATVAFAQTPTATGDRANMGPATLAGLWRPRKFALAGECVPCGS